MVNLQFLKLDLGSKVDFDDKAFFVKCKREAQEYHQPYCTTAAKMRFVH